MTNAAEHLYSARAALCLSVSSLDPADNLIVVYDHEAAISAAIELFTRNEAVANPAGDYPHLPA